jgi:uncharacterized membrane protein YkoI
MHNPRKHLVICASLALGLVALPAAAENQGQQQQGQQQQYMTPQPLPGDRSLEELFDEGKEQEVKLDAVPMAARNTIQQWATGGKVDKVELYTLQDGRVFYEAHIDKEGQKIEVVVAQNGQTIAKGKDTAD